jgi:hypothetical protein
VGFLTTDLTTTFRAFSRFLSLFIVRVLRLKVSESLILQAFQAA